MILNAGQFRWKELVFPVLIITIVFGLWMCEDEKMVQREYPRITGVSVTSVSDSGATFIADLYSMGTEKIVEFGFLWSKSRNITITGSEKICLGVPVNQGFFTAEVTRALEEGKEYFVRPYVITDVQLVYGPETSFISLGSLAPVIYGFSPDSAGWGDTLTIRGKNFSTVNNDVFLNNIKLIPATSSDTLIRVIIDGAVKTISNLLSVSTSGTKTSFTQKQFRFIKPSITDFSPKKGYWGDTIILNGKYLKYFLLNSTNSIRIGTEVCTLLSNTVENTLKFVIPETFSGATGQLSLKINGLDIYCSIPFNLLAPFFSFSPRQASWGSIITLEGRFNPLKSKSFVYFNDYSAEITSITHRKLNVKVPSDLLAKKSIIKYSAVPFAVTSADTFSIVSPVIHSAEPIVGSYGTLVTIKGKNFGSAPVVMFGNEKAFLVNSKDSVLTVKAPYCAPGTYNVKVTNKTLPSEQSISFTINQNEWSVIRPSQNYWTTSRNNNYSIGFSLNNKGYMTDGDGRVYSFDPDTKAVTYKFYDNLSWGPRLPVVVNDTCYIFYGTKIYRFSSTNLDYLSSINNSINGVAFQLNNRIYYGLSFPSYPQTLDKKLYKYDIRTKTSTQISTFTGQVNTYVISFQTINNKAYILFDDMSFYEYDPDSNLWSKKKSLPSTTRIIGTSSFVLNNKMYVVCGKNPTTSLIFDTFYCYKPESDSWEQKIPFPGEPRYNSSSFVINNKAYIGFGLNSAGNNLKEINIYDPIN